MAFVWKIREDIHIRKKKVTYILNEFLFEMIHLVNEILQFNSDREAYFLQLHVMKVGLIGCHRLF